MSVAFVFVVRELARNIDEMILDHRLQILALLGQVAILLSDLFI